MSFINSLKTKFFGKTKLTPSTQIDLTGIENMSKEQLSDLLKQYVTEYNAHLITCRDNLAKLEEKATHSESAESDLAIIKTINEMLQKQNDQLVAENNRIVSSSNILKDQIAKFTSELETIKAKATQLESALRQKHSLILEYEEKLGQLEEKIMAMVGGGKPGNFRNAIEALTSIQNEVESLRGENKKLLTEKENAEKILIKERVEAKKAIDAVERGITVLLKEKTELKDKVVRKAAINKQIQTEDFYEYKEKESNQIKVENLEKSLAETMNKIASLEKECVELKEIKCEKDAVIAKMKIEMKEAINENTDLKKRREIAIEEINKLTTRLSKTRKVKGEDSTLINSSKDKDKLKEQKVMFNVKKELEKLYKDFITAAFVNADEKDKEITKEGIHAKFIKVLERLADYCDDLVGNKPDLLAKLSPAPSK